MFLGNIYLIFILFRFISLSNGLPWVYRHHVSVFSEKRIDNRSGLLQVRGGSKDIAGKSTNRKRKSSKSSKRSSSSNQSSATSKATITKLPKKTTTPSKTTNKASPNPITSTKKTNPSSLWATASVSASSPNYRIQRELKQFLKDPPPNLTVKVGKNIRVWIIQMKGAKNTIYEGETFKLRVSFPAAYPTVPPSVYFLPPHIPVHEHVYTNGDICLSLLGKDWRPTMTAQSIAVSILSILSSATSKSLPMDNARHAQNKPGEYQKDWVYHDDNC